MCPAHAAHDRTRLRLVALAVVALGTAVPTLVQAIGTHQRAGAANAITLPSLTISVGVPAPVTSVVPSTIPTLLPTAVTSVLPSGISLPPVSIPRLPSATPTVSVPSAPLSSAPGGGSVPTIPGSSGHDIRSTQLSLSNQPGSTNGTAAAGSSATPGAPGAVAGTSGAPGGAIGTPGSTPGGSPGGAFGAVNLATSSAAAGQPGRSHPAGSSLLHRILGGSLTAPVLLPLLLLCAFGVAAVVFVLLTGRRRQPASEAHVPRHAGG